MDSHWLAVMRHQRHGTVLGAHLTADLIAMPKNIVSAGMTEYIDPRIARDLLRAVAPEDNFFVQSTTLTPICKPSRMSR